MWHLDAGPCEARVPASGCPGRGSTGGRCPGVGDRRSVPPEQFIRVLPVVALGMDAQGIARAFQSLLRLECKNMDLSWKYSIFRKAWEKFPYCTGNSLWERRKMHGVPSVMQPQDSCSSFPGFLCSGLEKCVGLFAI